MRLSKSSSSLNSIFKPNLPLLLSWSCLVAKLKLDFCRLLGYDMLTNPLGLSLLESSDFWRVKFYIAGLDGGFLSSKWSSWFSSKLVGRFGFLLSYTTNASVSGCFEFSMRPSGEALSWFLLKKWPLPTISTGVPSLSGETKPSSLSFSSANSCSFFLPPAFGAWTTWPYLPLKVVLRSFFSPLPLKLLAYESERLESITIGDSCPSSWSL